MLTSVKFTVSGSRFLYWLPQSWRIDVFGFAFPFVEQVKKTSRGKRQ
jgi:hypothetical protein